VDERLKEVYQKIYEGEAKAALRLKLFAKEADKEQLPQIAKLFRVISFSEEIHGERALRMLREIKDTEQNLKESFDSETAVAGWPMTSFSGSQRRSGTRLPPLSSPIQETLRRSTLPFIRRPWVT